MEDALPADRFAVRVAIDFRLAINVAQFPWNRPIHGLVDEIGIDPFQPLLKCLRRIIKGRIFRVGGEFGVMQPS